MWVRLRFWPLLFSIYTPFLHDHTESNGVKKYYLHAVNICMYICTYSAWTSSLNSGFAYPASYSILYFKKRFLLIFRERGREGERKGEKHQRVVASHMPSTGDQVCKSGMCPDWQLNLWPSGSQASAQSTDPHQPRLVKPFRLST